MWKHAKLSGFFLKKKKKSFLQMNSSQIFCDINFQSIIESL